MVRNRRIVPLVLAASLVAACAQNQTPVLCGRTGTNPALQVTLFFGRAIPGESSLSEADWSKFLHDVVTPALPNGFTVWDANGQWQSASGEVLRETSKVLLADIPDRPDRLNAIAQIRQAYSRRFHQQAVGMSLTSVCAAF